MDSNASLDIATQDLIRESLSKGGDYFEWGCGGSTVFASSLVHEDIISVENDPAWAEMVQRELANSNAVTAKSINFELIDLGPIRKWGYPTSKISALKAENYHRFPFQKFVQTRINDAHLTVLIDGRYRKSCALTVLMEQISDVTLVIDDAVNRPHLMEFIEKVGGFVRVGRSVVWQSLNSVDTGLLVDLQKTYVQDPR
jgi:hypothetical protein